MRMMLLSSHKILIIISFPQIFQIQKQLIDFVKFTQRKRISGTTLKQKVLIWKLRKLKSFKSVKVIELRSMLALLSLLMLLIPWISSLDHNVRLFIAMMVDTIHVLLRKLLIRVIKLNLRDIIIEKLYHYIILKPLQTRLMTLRHLILGI